MAAVKTVICEILEELLEEEFKDFKWHLVNEVTSDSIPRGKLEKADCRNVVDLMVQQYRDSDAGKIAVRVLRKVKQNALADQLKKKLQEVSVDVSAERAALSSEAAGNPPNAPTAGVTVSVNSSSGGSVKAPVLQGGVFHGPVTFNS